MATFVDSGYEGIADGTALTTGSPGNGDSSITTVSPGSGGTIAYDTNESAHGSGSVQLTQATAATTCYFQYNDGADFTTGAIRFMLFLSGSPSATCDFPCRFVNASNSSTFAFQMTSGRLLRISAGSTAQMTTALSLSTWYRVEGQMSSINSSGTITLKVYAGDSLTLIDSIQLTGLSIANAMRGVRLGKLSSATLASWNYDDVKIVSGSATEIGPATATVNITPSVILGAANVFDNFQVVIDSDPQPAVVATPPASIPAPTVTVSANVSVNATLINGTTAMDPATTTVSRTVDQPVTVAGQTIMADVEVDGGANPEPAVIATPAADLPTPSITITDTVAAAIIAPPVTSMPAPSVTVDTTVAASIITPPATTMPAPFVDTGVQANVTPLIIAPPAADVPAPAAITAITNAVIGALTITPPAPTMDLVTVATDQIVTALAILGVTTMDPTTVSGSSEVSAIIVAPPAATMNAVQVAGGAVASVLTILGTTTLDAVAVLAETNIFPLLLLTPPPTMDDVSVQTAGNATVLALMIAPPATTMDAVVASGGTDAFLTAVLIAPSAPTMDAVSILAGQGAFPPVDLIESVTVMDDPTVSGGTDVLVSATLISPPAPTMDAPTVTVTSSAFITAVSVDGVTTFFAPTVVAQTSALITPTVIDGQTSFPEPTLQTDTTLTAATIAPPAPTMDPPGILAGGGIAIVPTIIAPPAPTMTTPTFSTTSFVPAEVIDCRSTIYVPTIHAANRFPKFMSLKRTKRYFFTV